MSRRARSTGSLCSWQWIPFTFLTSFTKAVVRVVSKVVSQLGSCGFPAGRTIDEIDDHQHTDRSTPFDLHGRFLFKKKEWQVQGFLRSLGLSSSWVPRWEPIAVNFQGPRCGPTRPLAFNGTSSRPRPRVDSPAGVERSSLMITRGGRLVNCVGV